MNTYEYLWQFVDDLTDYYFIGNRDQWRAMLKTIQNCKEIEDIGYADMLLAVDETEGFNLIEFVDDEYKPLLKISY